MCGVCKNRYVVICVGPINIETKHGINFSGRKFLIINSYRLGIRKSKESIRLVDKNFRRFAINCQSFLPSKFCDIRHIINKHYLYVTFNPFIVHILIYLHKPPILHTMLYHAGPTATHPPHQTALDLFTLLYTSYINKLAHLYLHY